MKVFISHADEDEWLVRALIVPELEKLGIASYYFELNKMGTRIKEKVYAEIDACQHFLVLLTPAAIKSPWVIGESAIADIMGKTLVVFSMYVTEAEIPPSLREVQRRDMSRLSVYFEELKPYRMPELVGEKVEAIKQQAASNASADEFPASEVQQASLNPLKAPELRDRARRVMALAYSLTKTRGLEPPPKEPPPPLPEEPPPEPTAPRHKKKPSK